MTTVVGLDPSIASAGIAVIRTGATPTVGIVGCPGKDSDTLAVKAEHMRGTRNRVLPLIPDDTDLIVIEGLSYGHNRPNQDRIHHLWWLVIDAISLTHPGVHITVVPPSTLKKIITDNGRADKKLIKGQMRQWWPDVPLSPKPSADDADALALATIGAIHMRIPMPFHVSERIRLAIAERDLPERPAR